MVSKASSQKEWQAINSEIQALQVKQTIVAVPPCIDQFTSRLFVIPKKDRSLCPVINLKPLNCCMENRRFKMEGIGKVKELLREGDWMCTVDLKDTYLSVPIARQHRKFRRFVWEGTTFEFTHLPFGLCSAPRIFTKVLRPVMAHLCFQRLRTVIYLDNILIMAKDKDTLVKQVHYTVQLLERLGCTINVQKSALESTRQIVYLGLLVNSETMKLYLPEEKTQLIIKDCSQVLSKNVITAQPLASVIGRLSAARPPVLPAPSTPVDSDTGSFRILQVTSDTEPRLPGGNDVVDPPAASLEWMGHYDSPATIDNTVGCVTKRVGG